MIKKIWIDSTEQRVHLIGKYVGVAWNFDWVPTAEGLAREKQEGASPYIGAWTVYDVDEFGVADVESDVLFRGMDIEWARKLHEELGRAIEYFAEIEG